MTHFEPPMFFRYVIDVSYHVAEFAKITWEPWTDGSKSYIGWEGKFHDQSKPNIYCYLVVDTDAPRPTIQVHFGFTGDPNQDEIVGEVTDDRG